MNVISISIDRNILKENSPSRLRQIEYGRLFSETHIILFCKKGYLKGENSGREKNEQGQQNQQNNRVAHATQRFAQVVQISPNVWVYPTNSFLKLRYFRDAFRVAGKIIRERGFLKKNTVVTAQDPFETGIVGQRIKKCFDIPLHVQIHTDVFSPYFSSFSLINFIRVKIAKKILPEADAIRVVSQRIADSLKNSGLKLSIEPNILPIFVDIEKIKNSPVSVDLHKKYPDYDFIILMTTRLAREKNIPLAIEAVSNVQSRTQCRIGLIIVGDGPENYRLHKLVKELKIGKNVVFEAWQSPENLFSYYKTADLFLSTSWYEGYGMSMVEAAATGCDIVATDAGIARELTKNICPPGDKNCLAEKIGSLVGENTGGQNQYQYRHEHQHEVALSRIGIDKVVLKNKQKYLELYRESLGF